MLSSFLPGALIKQNTEQFLAKSASITTENWLIGTIVILISLSIGITIYNKKNLLVWGAHFAAYYSYLASDMPITRYHPYFAAMEFAKNESATKKIINQFGTNEQLRNNLPGKELNSF